MELNVTPLNHMGRLGAGVQLVENVDGPEVLHDRVLGIIHLKDQSANSEEAVQQGKCFRRLSEAVSRVNAVYLEVIASSGETPPIDQRKLQSTDSLHQPGSPTTRPPPSP